MEREVEMKSTTKDHTGTTATEQHDHVTRLNFSNPKLRDEHIHAFLEWLPQVLHEAPGMHWEDMPSRVMCYLIRSVADHPDAITITLATGCAMGMKRNALYHHCNALAKRLGHLRHHYGMTMLAELGRRSIWEHFVNDRLISPGELTQLKYYDSLASTYLPLFVEGLTERQQGLWKPYLLPRLPPGFLNNHAQQKAILKASEERRKEQSDVLLPLFPLLVEIAQLRKQATERLIKEYRRQRDRAIAGEIELPYQYRYRDRQLTKRPYLFSFSFRCFCDRLSPHLRTYSLAVHPGDRRTARRVLVHALEPNELGQRTPRPVQLAGPLGLGEARKSLCASSQWLLFAVRRSCQRPALVW